MLRTTKPAPSAKRPDEEKPGAHYSRKQYEKKTRRRQTLWTDGSVCSLCGFPIALKDLNPDPYKRDIEETWCVHYQCREKALNLLDRDTGMADYRK